MSARIPDRYVPAVWRDLTPIDPETREIGIGFTTAAGHVFFKLNEGCVAHIADQFAVYRDDLTNSQSPRSPDGDSAVLRAPEETLKCDP